MSQYLSRMPLHRAVNHDAVAQAAPIANISKSALLAPATSPVSPTTASGSITNTTTNHSTIGGSRG